MAVCWLKRDSSNDEWGAAKGSEWKGKENDGREWGKEGRMEKGKEDGGKGGRRKRGKKKLE